MAEPAEDLRIGRIVIALGGETGDAGVLRVVADLAAAMRSEIVGVFVEDINLVHLSGLPFARELSHYTTGERRLEREATERLLRARAATAQRALSLAAAQTGAAWRFRTARGVLAAELAAAAAEADVLAIGASRRVAPPHDEFWRIAGTLRPQSRNAATQGRAPERPVMAVLTGTPGAGRCLAIASRQARATGQPLTVLVMPPSPEAAASLQAQVMATLGRPETPSRTIPVRDLEELVRLVRAERPCALVIEADDRVLEPRAVQVLCEGLPCPTLLVRSAPGSP